MRYLRNTIIGLTIDLAGELYTVPAGDRLQVNLPAGAATFSASAGASAANGQVTVEPGRYVEVSFTREAAPDPDYNLGELAPTPVVQPLLVNIAPLEPATVAASADPVATPTVAPTATGTPMIVGQPGLHVTNYIGEGATFTIYNQSYTVPAGETTYIPLLPGEYTYTASIPFAASNGTVDVSAGRPTPVSLALNSAGDAVLVFLP